MSDYGGLRYWSRKTRHSTSQHLNEDGISDNESLGVSAGEERRGYRSIETTLSYFKCFVVYHSGDQSGDYGRGGNRSQGTRHYSTHNCGSIVDIDRRGEYRSHTSHYYSHNPGGRGRLLGLSFYSIPIE